MDLSPPGRGRAASVPAGAIDRPASITTVHTRPSVGIFSLVVVVALLATACSTWIEAPTAALQRAPIATSTAPGLAAPGAAASSAPPAGPAQGAPASARPSITPPVGGERVSDACREAELPSPPALDPTLVVLDKAHVLARDLVPPDLVRASRAGFTGVSGRMLIRRVLAGDLGAMRKAAAAAGVTLLIDSSYRSYATQARTLKTWIARLGTEAGLDRAARPGHSEHQLGTAFDFASPGWTGKDGDWAVDTAAGRWMAAHAWEYGFVMSFPAGSRDRTCFSYEPWHYRWIGRTMAARQHASGVTLREFLIGIVPGADDRNR